MSDLAPPEHAGRAAFEDLQAVIRHVTEQLAGYRRRALSAEAQVRELETALARTSGVAERAQVAEAARATRVAELERALAAAESAVEAATAAAAREPVAAVAAGDGDAGVAEENRLLRDRLTEAAERTRQIAERVRFLRQQLGNGSDR